MSHPHSLFTEAFHALRTFLTLSAGARAQTIAITSALPAEGKTTTSACLARAAAGKGVRTILVDLDLRRRGASMLFGISQADDLCAYLEGAASLDATVLVDEASGLHLLGVSQAPKDGVNLLTEARLRAMLNDLRGRYDLIVLDTAPVLGVAEARLIAALADRVLLLTRWKKTSVRAVNGVVDMLVDGGAVIPGLALTQVDITRCASTGGGDVFGYAKVFRDYYSD